MKKRTAVIVITILSLALIVSAAFFAAERVKNNDTNRQIAANYRHAFSEIVNGVSELDSTLQKSLLVTSTSLAGTVCSEVYAKAQVTSMALGTLPFSATELEKTVSFINTVGDYAFALAHKAAQGKEFSQEDKDGLKALSEVATSLAKTFRDLDSEMGSEMVSLSEYQRTLREYDEREEDFIPSTLADSISISEEEFPEIPSLIYDGPFSEHLKNSSPKFLEGKEEIDEAQGRRIAAEFLGVRPEQVYPTGQQEGLQPCYCYAAEINGDQVSISVTKTGGVVSNVLSSRAVQSKVLSTKEALDAAKKMLDRWGFTDMKESYYIIYNNVLTANFAYTENEVIFYPDLIKLSVALDNGALISFESTGYISFHGERELPEETVGVDQAREKVPEGYQIDSEAKAVIPTPGKYEMLCYEFTCQDSEGRQYIVYVNAATGEQERILLLLQDEGGTLTM